MASSALSQILKRQASKNYLANCPQNLPMILSCLTNLMQEIDYHGLVISLECIIESFTEEIAPHSAVLIDKLIKSYFDYKTNHQKDSGAMEAADKHFMERQNMGQDIPDYILDETDDSEANLAAIGCLEAILRIINTNLSLESYKQLAPKIANLLNVSLIEGREDDIRVTISMLCRVIYKLDAVPDKLLLYYPLLCYIWLGKPDKLLQMNPANFGEQINT